MKDKGDEDGFTFNFERDGKSPGESLIEAAQDAIKDTEREPHDASNNDVNGGPGKGKTDNRSGRIKHRKEFEPASHCPKCGGWLDNDLAVQAWSVLRDMGVNFYNEIGKNRQDAFENLAKSLAENLPVLVVSRTLDLDPILNILVDIHKMLGAPKIEGTQESPLTRLRDWLNGEDELGTPDA